MNVCTIVGLVIKSVNPDQTPRSAASDQGRHCLLKSGCPGTWRKYGYLINSNSLGDHPGSAPALRISSSVHC